MSFDLAPLINYVALPRSQYAESYFRSREFATAREDASFGGSVGGLVSWISLRYFKILDWFRSWIGLKKNRSKGKYCKHSEYLILIVS